MSIIKVDYGELAGGGYFKKVTLTEGESKTVTLPFEVKTIVFADTVQTTSGYSGLWSKNLNFSNHTFFWAATNQMIGLISITIGSANARIQSISADGKIVGLYSNTRTGGTTFWLYGDEE